MNLQLVEVYFPHLLSLYNSYPYNIQRVDFVRVLYLLKFGGIYSDLDIEPLRAFDDLLIGNNGITNGSTGSNSNNSNNGNNSVYLLADGPTMRFTNMIMASSRNHPFWLQVIEDMKDPTIPWWAGSRHFYIMSTTGPFVIDRVAKAYDSTIILFPGKYVQPCSNCENTPCTKDNAYVKMLGGGSWTKWDSIAIRTVACQWPKIIGFVIFLILLITVILLMSGRNSG